MRITNDTNGGEGDKVERHKTRKKFRENGVVEKMVNNNTRS